MTQCRHCLEEIESFNGYDYVTRGLSWKHVNSGSMWCQQTAASPLLAVTTGGAT